MSIKALFSASVVACAMSAVGVAQGPPPPQQNYPPQQQNYPPPQQQGYPPQQGYPAQQGYPQQPPPRMAPQQLDQLVGRVALYPDPLLAQVLTGATYSNEIADAATWATQHSYLHSDELSRAMNEDNLQFDPSVMALLPFPSVLDMMARDPGWTQALGDAVLGQRPDVMDAVQRMRDKAMESGYLETNSQDRVVDNGPGDIEILPINAGYVYVPFYDPLVVYAPRRPGFFIGAGITFGPGIYVGAFAPFGWAGPVLGWRTHDIFFDHRAWGRSWVNRGSYVHPYAYPAARAAGPRVERHVERPAPRRERR